MASVCSSKIAQRTSLSVIKSAIKSNVGAFSSSKSTANISAAPIKSTSTSTLRRSFLTSRRIAPELGCAQSMLPLHSAVAEARMTSCLITTSSSRSFRALSQGTLCCTSPGP